MFPTKLIVSCQALAGNPLRNSEALAIMAEAAAIGGASAIRANGVEDIAAISRRVDIPIIGIDKRHDSSGRVVITPNFTGAKAIHEAGADIIALEVVDYPSDIREDRRELIRRIHDELGCLVMADISTLEEAVTAAEMGADAVSTTLAGYIPNAKHTDAELYSPDFSLIKKIAELKLPCKLVAEGRIWERADLAEAFRLGADAVVIGKAITNPMAITRYFRSALTDSPVPIATEAVNPATSAISDSTTPDILRLINAEDAKVAKIVEGCIPEVARLVDEAVECIKAGGHIIYCGAGTSGRLAVADAAECPPTYGVERETVRAVIAGGHGAIVNASEGCEDDCARGIEAFHAENCTENDLIIGISAAGRAPFVLAFMEEAKKLGCTVGAIVNNPHTEMAELADITVEALTGAEAIKGSTRLKGGSSQKMILNMFSTALFIKLGCTYKNYMVNMTPSNSKLRRRAVNMLVEILETDENRAQNLLEKHDWSIKNALKEGLCND